MRAHGNQGPQTQPAEARSHVRPNPRVPRYLQGLTHVEWLEYSESLDHMVHMNVWITNPWTKGKNLGNSPLQPPKTSLEPSMHTETYYEVHDDKSQDLQGRGSPRTGGRSRAPWRWQPHRQSASGGVDTEKKMSMGRSSLGMCTHTCVCRACTGTLAPLQGECILT